MNAPVHNSYEPPGLWEYSFEVSTNSCVAATALKLTVNYGDGEVETRSLSQLPHAAAHDFQLRGNYSYTASLTDGVITRHFSGTVRVMYDIWELDLVVTPEHAPKGRTVQFGIKMDRGEEIYYELDFGDNTPNATKYVLSNTDLGTEQHTYSTCGGGSYLVTLSAYCPLGKTTIEYLIDCQEPVTNWGVTSNAPTANTNVSLTLDLPAGVPFPTNPFYIIDYGDGQTSGAVAMTNGVRTVVVTHTYAVKGKYSVNVTIYNDVSSEEFLLQVLVYDPIVSVTGSATFIPSLPVNSPAIIPVHGNYPDNKPIIFHVQATPDLAENYGVEANGNLTLGSNGSSPFISLTLQAGTYLTKYQAWNGVGAVQTPNPGPQIIVIEAMEGFDVVEGPNIPTGGFKSFHVSFTKFSSSVCLKFTPDVGAGIAGVTMYYGSAQTCLLVFGISLLPRNLNQLSTLSSTSPYAAGSFVARFEASDTIETVTKDVHFTVSPIDCFEPTVHIEQAETNFSEPQKVEAREMFTVIGHAEVNCPAGLSSIKFWKVEVYHPENNTLAGNASLPSYTNMSFSHLHFYPRALPYGLYKFTFGVQMTPGSESFVRMAHTYIEVTASQLEIAMVDGKVSYMEVDGSGILRLSAHNFSSDPDLAQSQPQMFDSFRWFCRRSYETLEKNPDGTYSQHNVSSPLTAATIANVSDYGGCFRQGPGMLQETTGHLAFNKAHLYENVQYEISVEVTKDQRRGTAVIIIVIRNGAPQVSFRCVSDALCFETPQGLAINPAPQLSIQGSCLDNCGTPTVPVTYTYSMFRRDSFGIFVPIVDFDQFAQGDFGLQSKSISILQGLFDKYSSVEAFRITMEGTKGNVTSTTYSDVFFNKPPVNGTCSIAPLMGTSLQTNFTLQCSGWKDPEDLPIKSYTFFAIHDDEPFEQLIDESDRSDVYTQLPIGPPQYAYNKTIYARITDVYDANTIVKMAVIQVTEPPVSVIEEWKQQIINNDTNLLEKALVEGDIPTAPEIVKSIASLLNSEITTLTDLEALGYEVSVFGGGSTTDFSKAQPVPTNLTTQQQEALREQYEKERDLNAEVRGKLIDALAAMPLDSPESVELVAGALESTAANPLEIPQDQQVTGMALLENALDSLELMKDAISPDRFSSIASTIISAAIKIAHSSVVSASLPLPSDLQTNSQADILNKYLETRMDISLSGVPGETAVTSIAEAETLAKQMNNWDIQASLDTNMRRISDRILGETASLLQSHMVAGETPWTLQTNEATVTIIKTTGRALSGMSVDQLTGDNQTVSGPRQGYTFPDWCDLQPAGACDNSTDSPSLTVVSVITFNTKKLTQEPDPLITKPPTVCLDCPTMSLQLLDQDGESVELSNTTKPIEMFLPRHQGMSVPSALVQGPSSGLKQPMHFVNFTIISENAALHIQVYPQKGQCPSDQFLVAVKFGDGYPDLVAGDWDYIYLTPAKVSFVNATQMKQDADFHTVFLDNTLVNNYQGPVSVGIRPLTAGEYDSYPTGSHSNMTTAQRKSLPFSDVPFAFTLSVRVFTSGCYYFDSALNKWTGDDCTVGELTNHYTTQCHCKKLPKKSVFGAGWLVLPNTIDFRYAFANMDFLDNPTIYATLIAIFAIYILIAVWSRRKDRRDHELIGLIPLADNLPEDNYLYEVVVRTGMRKNAGTESKVHFIVSGEFDETEVRFLSPLENRKILVRGTTDHFLLAVPKPLGPLNYLRMWHDNSGSGKMGSWYCSTVAILDIQTKEKFAFLMDNWLAVEEGDGEIDRVASVASDDDQKQLKHLFGENSAKNLSDEHIWFSVFTRPPTSRFTRLQRASCCLMVLSLTMLTSAMYYEQVPSGSRSQNSMSAGPFSLSVEQISVGFISTLLVFPVSALVIQLFRKTRERKARKSRVDEALAKALKMKGEAAVAGVTAGLTAPGAKRQLTQPWQDKNKNRKPPFSLPWYFIIIGWVVLGLCVAASFFFVLLYGITFGEEKVQSWVSSLVISFITSVFVTQPIKVVAAAILLSLIFRKTTDDDDTITEEDSSLRKDEQWLQAPPDTMEDKKLKVNPPGSEELQKAREYRLKEVKMFDVIREILSYLSFLWVLMVVAMLNRDPQGYNMMSGIRNMFIYDHKYNFSTVSNSTGYFKWMEYVLVPKLRAQPWYNKDPALLQRGFLSDRQSRLMGYVTMRQQRIMKDTCKVAKEVGNTIAECIDSYSISDEETGAFDVGWAPRTGNGSSVPEEYHYRDGDEMDSYPYYGRLALYGGGGYYVTLRGGETDLLTIVKRLNNGSWIDRHTRAVFTEFTVYNPGVNLFTICTIIAEFVPAGGIVSYWRFQPATLITNFSSAKIFEYFCQAAFCAFILFFIIKEIRNLVKEKREYFKSFWTWIELSIITMGLCSIAMYFHRYFETRKLLTYFRETSGKSYSNFQYVAYWTEMLDYFLGFLVFIANVKFVKLLRFNKRMAMLGSVLNYSAKKIAAFGLIFLIIFLSFVQFFYLLFGSSMSNYSSFVKSGESCFNIMLGKFRFLEMSTTNRVLAPILFLGFVVMNVFILLNMFLSILNDAYTVVKAEIALQNNDHEIVDFLMNKFKGWVGMLKGKPGQRPKMKLKTPEDEPPPQPYSARSLRQIPFKLDRLVDVIYNVYVDEPERRFPTVRQVTSARARHPPPAPLSAPKLHPLVESGASDSTHPLSQVQISPDPQIQ